MLHRLLPLTLLVACGADPSGPTTDGREAFDLLALEPALVVGPDGPDAALFTTDDDGAQLAPGGTIEWEIAGRGRLELRGRFESAVHETALIELVERDPLRNARGDELARLALEVGPNESESNESEPPALAHEVVAGPAHDYLVRLSWPDDAGAPLVIRELRGERDALDTSTLPPIVFVSVDTLAAHALGLYGYARDTSPNLERFAQDAIVFDAARANAPWTVPSYASQFTGLLPSASEYRTGAPERGRFRLGKARLTLAELLGARGYACEAIVDNPWLSAIEGVEQGFERFDVEPTERHLDDVDGGMRLVFPRGLERLEALVDAERVPFLFLQVLDVHGTYFTPDDMTGRFGSREARDGDALLTVKPDGDLRAGMVHRYIAQSLGEPISEAGGERVSARRLTAAYDEGVADFDREFGRFVDGLRSLDLYDDALIVVTADHGEARQDDPWPFTHKLPREDTLRVPLLVKLPGGERGGARVSTAVTLVDLFPTFAELTGAPVDEAWLDGRSLVPALRGEELEPRPSIATHGAFEGRTIVMGAYALTLYEHRRFSDAELLSYAPLFEAWSAFDPSTAQRLAADGFEPGADDPRVAGGDEAVAAAAWSADLRTSRRRFAREAPLYRELVRLDGGGATPVSLRGEEERVRATALGATLRSAMERSAGRALEQLGYASADPAARERDDLAEALRRLGYVDGVAEPGDSGDDGD